MGTDVIERYVTEDGKLYSKRVIISSWKIPSFLRVFVNDPLAYAVEYCTIDPKAKTLISRSQNLNVKWFIVMDEKYNFYSDDKDSTAQLHHEARIKSNSHVSKYIDHKAENYVVSVLTDAARKGRLAMESVIEVVEEEMRAAEDK